MSEVLSMHDHGNCELCDQLESELALLRREFPMQDGPPIPWRLAEEIYAVYHDVYGNDQTLERLAERGGFGWGEIPVFRKDYMSKRGSWPWIRELIKEQEGETT